MTARALAPLGLTLSLLLGCQGAPPAPEPPPRDPSDPEWVQRAEGLGARVGYVAASPLAFTHTHEVRARPRAPLDECEPLRVAAVSLSRRPRRAARPLDALARLAITHSGEPFVLPLLRELSGARGVWFPQPLRTIAGWASQDPSSRRLADLRAFLAPGETTLFNLRLAPRRPAAARGDRAPGLLRRESYRIMARRDESGALQVALEVRRPAFAGSDPLTRRHELVLLQPAPYQPGATGLVFLLPRREDRWGRSLALALQVGPDPRLLQGPERARHQAALALAREREELERPRRERAEQRRAERPRRRPERDADSFPPRAWWVAAERSSRSAAELARFTSEGLRHELEALAELLDLPLVADLAVALPPRALEEWVRGLPAEERLRPYELLRGGLRALEPEGEGEGAELRVGLLDEHCGALSLLPGRLREITRACCDLPGFEREVFAANLNALAAERADLRAAAARWLRARGALPSDYDPWASAELRNLALRKADSE